MSSALNPFGLVPILHPSGEANIRQVDGAIASGYASQINQYQPVMLLATTGTIAPCTASSDQITGAFLGCLFQVPGGRPTFSNYWPASTTLASNTTAIAYYTDDPNIIYRIQATGALTATSVGHSLVLSNFTATNGLGFSAATLNSGTTATAGGTGQVQVYGVDLDPGNAWNDTYTIVRVKLANSQFQAVTPSL